MPRMHKTKAESNNTEVVMKLQSIKDIDEDHPHFEKTKLAYEFTFIGELPDKSTKLFSSKTLATLSARDWKTRFYKTEKQNEETGRVFENTAFSRYQDLNALMEIMRANKDADVVKGDEDGDFDIDLLIGKVFPASVVLTDKFEFIDWIETFRLCGVKVWDARNGVWESEAVPTPEPSEVASEANIDGEGLPF